MVGVFVEATVKEFDAWFPGFEANSERKSIEAEHGVKCMRVIQDVDNPNHCFAIMHCPSEETFDTFWSDPRIVELLKGKADMYESPPVKFGAFNPHILEE